MTWLLTGATGMLGCEILRQLIKDGEEVICLVRGTNQGQAEARIRARLGHPIEQVPIHIICGDLTQPKLGLSERNYRAFARETKGIIHSAAKVDFGQSLDRARNTNVAGTKAMLAFAQEAMQWGGLERFEHLSTAYICGTRRGIIKEDERDQGQTFHNAYEQSKLETELLVEAAKETVPVCILRPSIIVGDSETGYTASFHGIYWPLRILAGGKLWIIPADRQGRLDLVPVNYVVQAMAALRKLDASIGQTIHLTAGDKAIKMGHFLQASAQFFQVRTPFTLPPRFFQIAPEALLDKILGTRLSRKYRQGKIYYPYLAHHARFSTIKRDHLLDDLPVPAILDYLTKLLQYCVASKWGTRQLEAGH